MADTTAKSPQDCATMVDVRAEIDRLDRLIVAYLAERSGYVARAAEVKKDRAQVVDVPRIEDVVAKVREQAVSFGADPELIEAIYRSMIAAFIAYEERTFDNKRRG